MNVLSLFDGMSCGRIALDRAGITVDNYYASEVDKYAIKVARANWPDTVQLGDVTGWREWDVEWASIDLLIGGSPCQGFSLVGKQLSFDDPRSKLFFIYVDILNHIKSLNPDVKFLLENVRMKEKDLDVITDFLGVDPIYINSNLFSPQSRPRWYWSNFILTSVVFGLSDNKAPDYTSILDQDVIDAGFLPATVRKGNPRPVKLTGDKFLCLTSAYYKGVRADGRPALATGEGVFDDMRDNDKCRMLTPVECERLQTVPDNYTAHVSNTQRYKMLGNGWTVDVIAHIFNGLN